MVASRQVEFLFYRGSCRQRGRAFGDFAQFIGRTEVPFCENMSSQLQNVCSDLLEFVAPDSTEVVMLLMVKKIKRASNTVGGQTVGNRLGSDSNKWSSSRVIPTEAAK